jgi:hypothetical protein
VTLNLTNKTKGEKLRNLLLLFVTMFGLSLYAFAQSSPAAAPAANAVASAVQAVPVAPVVAAAPAVPMSAGFIGIVIAIVAGLNVLLSSVQKVFSGLSKSEPGWLQSLSSVVLEIAKFLGSNPSV